MESAVLGIIGNREGQDGLHLSVPQDGVVAGVVSEVVVIAPTQAEAWLSTRETQRSLRPRSVMILAEAMRRGDWQLNGESIKFDEEGHLLDGQHRLQAIVETGIPCACLVVRGVPHASITTVDIGMKRSIGDGLYMRGERNVYLLGAALRWIWRYEHGLMGGHVSALQAPHFEMLYAVLECHPGIREYLGLMHEIQSFIPRSLAAALFYLFSTRHEALERDFRRKVLTGANLAPGDPALVLRKRLADESRKKARLPYEYLAAITIRAWNGVVQNRSIRILRWSTEAENPEPFPVIL